MAVISVHDGVVYVQTLAKHVMNVHLNAVQTLDETPEGEVPLNTLKKYISFVRS